MYCQYTLTRPCESTAAFRLTFRSASGFEWIERQCRSHADPRKDQERQKGSELIAVEEIPAPPDDPRVAAMLRPADAAS